MKTVKITCKKCQSVIEVSPSSLMAVLRKGVKEKKSPLKQAAVSENLKLARARRWFGHVKKVACLAFGSAIFYTTLTAFFNL